MKPNILVPAFLLAFLFSAFFVITDVSGNGDIQGKVVSYGNRAASNTLVFIEDITGDFEPPAEHGVVRIFNSEFIPRMLPVLKGTVVDFENADAWHNVYSPEQSVTPFNLGTFAPGETRSIKLETVGIVPVTDFMHLEMRTYVIVLGNPYFSETDKNGRFLIKDVPAGTHSLRVWNEKWHADKQKVTVEDGKVLSVDFTLR